MRFKPMPEMEHLPGWGGTPWGIIDRVDVCICENRLVAERLQGAHLRLILGKDLEDGSAWNGSKQKCHKDMVIIMPGTPFLP